MTRPRVRCPTLALAVCGAVLACDASGAPGNAYETKWIDSAAFLESRFGEATFEARDGNRLSVFVYRATGFDPSKGPIWFVMHGAGRSAKRYLQAAAPVAERYDAVAIAIEFPEAAYRRSEDYTLNVDA